MRCTTSCHASYSCTHKATRWGVHNTAQAMPMSHIDSQHKLSMQATAAAVAGIKRPWTRRPVGTAAGGMVGGTMGGGLVGGVNTHYNKSKVVVVCGGV